MKIEMFVDIFGCKYVEIDSLVFLYIGMIKEFSLYCRISSSDKLLLFKRDKIIHSTDTYELPNSDLLIHRCLTFSYIACNFLMDTLTSDSQNLKERNICQHSEQFLD